MRGIILLSALGIAACGLLLKIILYIVPTTVIFVIVAFVIGAILGGG